MAYVSVNEAGAITAISDRRFTSFGCNTVRIEATGDARQYLGKRLVDKGDRLRVAMICNWGQECGISTYAKYLADALRPKLAELKIFAEQGGTPEEGVDQCWERGHSMTECMNKIDAYNPDFVLIQHEFGIFPKAPCLLQMLQRLDRYPHAVILHSTYEHLDKSVCTAAMKSIIVHTDTAKGILRNIGNSSDIRVIPHGCVRFGDRKELWNIFQTQHAIVQFGFGFGYKGVDRAIDAVHLLKTSKPDKYDGEHDNIFYCYYCSENSHTRNIHSNYVSSLTKKVKDLGLEDNVAIIRKWNTDQEINNILRTAKLAIYPYLINPENVVYGASGAIRISFANGIPCIASESHLFDEIPGLARPSNSTDLAREIDLVFSDAAYRSRIVARQNEFCAADNWDVTADRYLSAMIHFREPGTVAI